MNISPDINVYTCIIGKRATQAKYYISDPQCVVQILDRLNTWQRDLKRGTKALKQRKSLANFGVQGFMSRNMFGIGKKEAPVKTRIGEFTRHGASKYKALK